MLGEITGVKIIISALYPKEKKKGRFMNLPFNNHWRLLRQWRLLVLHGSLEGFQVGGLLAAIAAHQGADDEEER